MATLFPVPDRLALDGVAKRIRRSSNFRFAWQFYEFSGLDPRTAGGARQFLAQVAQNRDCHAFLRDSADDPNFVIAPVAHIVETFTFEETLAAAACDRLGAYSHDLRPPPAKECLAIARFFQQIGPYCAFSLEGTGAADFTNWFFGVAWDWCFLLTWPSQHVAWLGCLTDTD